MPTLQRGITSFRIECRYFVAQIDVKNDSVIETAPILKYMEGWHIDRIKKYIRHKGWEMEAMD